MTEIASVRSVFALHAHLVYVTKFRSHVFDNRHLTRLEEIMQAMGADFLCEVVEFNADSQHVHLLVTFPPKSPCRRWSTASRACPHGG
ncbi:IS200/IS605 family transposase [Micromonospora sp. IBHARD004]|uniref:IS200/IS605 family transposase n=1 Tax=Micromonospora sp. IBHARD004 TaxID=3457764 RepID=UPI00405859C3